MWRKERKTEKPILFLKQRNDSLLSVDAKDIVVKSKMNSHKK